MNMRANIIATHAPKKVGKAKLITPEINRPVGRKDFRCEPWKAEREGK
jgi:hypothetical protein